MVDCVECRDVGVTKRGVCFKCRAGEDFLTRSDGGIRAWLDPSFAKALRGGGEKSPPLADRLKEARAKLAQQRRDRPPSADEDYDRRADEDRARTFTSGTLPDAQSIIREQAAELERLEAQQQRRDEDLAELRRIVTEQAAELDRLRGKEP